MANKINAWLKNNNIEKSLDIQYVFCHRWHIAPSTSIQWVTQSFPVLAMLTKGNGKVALDCKSRKFLSLEMQKPFFLPANLKRSPQPAPPNGLEMLAIGFQVRILGGVDLLNFLEIPFFYNPTINERLYKLMWELYTLELSHDNNWFQYIVAKKRICNELVENIIASSSFCRKTTLTLMENCRSIPAIQYLNENFTTTLNIPKLMKLCSLSRTHLFRLFKAQTNTTPFEYMKLRRLQKAQDLLLNTYLPISEVGEQVGWENPFHFSRIFKKEIGLSPSHYRMQFSKSLVLRFDRTMQKLKSAEIEDEN